jgi:hypothetical protein
MAEVDTEDTEPASSTTADEHEVDESEQRLEELRPFIKPGFVYALDDDDTGRTNAGKKRRPAVLVRVPPLDARPAIALQQRVQISTRVSWKTDKWGPPPTTVGDREYLLKRWGWAFSPARSLPAFNKDGIFEIRRLYPVTVSTLLRGHPLGWLAPPDLARRIMAQSGVGLPDRYPPDDPEGGDA